MSDKRTLHDEALALLAMPQLGTYLTPDQRELVLRALEDMDDLAKEVKRLQQVAAESQLLFGVKVARVSVLFEESGGIHLIATCPGGDEKALGELVADKISSLLGTDEEDSLAPAPKEAAASSEPPAAPPPTTQVARDVLFTPAERPNEEKHGTEAEHRKDRPLPEPREPERRVSARAPSGGGHGGDERDARGVVHPQPDGTVLQPVGAVQPDAEAGPLELAAAGVAVPRWGRARDLGAAWHLWREGVSDTACGEATDGDIEWLGENQAVVVAEQTCLDCKDIAFADAAKKLPAPNEPRCAGHNRSANVPCNTSRVFVQRDGKWFCRRHDPARGERLAAEEGAA